MKWPLECNGHDGTGRACSLVSGVCAKWPLLECNGHDGRGRSGLGRVCVCEVALISACL